MENCVYVCMFYMWEVGYYVTDIYMYRNIVDLNKYICRLCVSTSKVCKRKQKYSLKRKIIQKYRYISTRNSIIYIIIIYRVLLRIPFSIYCYTKLTFFNPK